MYIQDPLEEWARVNVCGGFACTGMYNIALYFESSKLKGDVVPVVDKYFTIVSDNKESTSVSTISTCTMESAWNAWLCATKNIGVMIFDNKDADRLDRAIAPIHIRNNRGFDNRLNSFMNACKSGYYTDYNCRLQHRVSRFATIVDLKSDITIDYTGTPPAE